MDSREVFGWMTIPLCVGGVVAAGLTCWLVAPVLAGALCVGLGGIAARQRQVGRAIGWAVAWRSYGAALGGILAWVLLIGVLFPLVQGAGRLGTPFFAVVELVLVGIAGLWAVERFGVGRCYRCTRPVREWVPAWDALVRQVTQGGGDEVAATFGGRGCPWRLRWQGAFAHAASFRPLLHVVVALATARESD